MILQFNTFCEKTYDKFVDCKYQKFQVLVKGEEDLMGKMVEVEIYETGKHFMKAKIVDNTQIIHPGLKEPLRKGEVSGASVEKVGGVCFINIVLIVTHPCIIIVCFILPLW